MKIIGRGKEDFNQMYIVEMSSEEIFNILPYPDTCNFKVGMVIEVPKMRVIERVVEILKHALDELDGKEEVKKERDWGMLDV